MKITIAAAFVCLLATVSLHMAQADSMTIPPEGVQPPMVHGPICDHYRLVKKRTPEYCTTNAIGSVPKVCGWREVTVREPTDCVGSVSPEKAEKGGGAQGGEQGKLKALQGQSEQEPSSND